MVPVLLLLAASLGAATARAAAPPYLHDLTRRDGEASVPLHATWLGGNIGLELTIGDTDSPTHHGTKKLAVIFTSLNFSHTEMQLAVSCPNCTGFMPMYQPEMATSVEDLPQPYEGFNQGTIYKVYRDKVRVGEYTVDGQDFGGVDLKSYLIRPFLPGTVGMGFAPAREFLEAGKDANRSFMHRLSSQWKEPVLGLYVQKFRLTRWLSPSVDVSTEAGEVKFGGVNEVYMDGPMRWHKTDGRAWRLPIDAIKVNDKVIDIGSLPATQGNSSATAKRAIHIDPSKRALAGLPAGLLDAIMAETPGAVKRDYAWTVPCGAEFNMTFTIDGVDYVFPATDVIFHRVIGTVAQGLPNNDECRTAILVVPDGGTMYLGRLFFAGVYSAFDLGPEPRIGLAQLKPGFPVRDATDPEAPLFWAANKNRAARRDVSTKHAAVFVAISAAFFLLI